MIAADSTGLVQAIVVALLGGGLFGGIYALLKLRPEAGQISVTAAQGAVIVQTGVIESLRKDLEARNTEIASLRVSVADAHSRIRGLEQENESLRQAGRVQRDENLQLQDRVGMLELQLQGLEEGTT